MRKFRNLNIGLVGVGNMGTSIFEGAIKKNVVTPSHILIYDKIAAKAGAFARKTGVKQAKSIPELWKNSKIILLAMKPQDFSAFAAENKKYLEPGHIIVSILAGMTTKKITKELGKKVAVVRAMPNLGAKAGQSMTVVCGKNKQGLSLARTLFSGCGEVVALSEKTLDLVTAVSGSGPAYFFYLMEFLTDFGVKYGLSSAVARMLAVQTGLGAALLAKSADVSCAELRRMVTSKKGTTEAALKTLQRGKFKKVFQRALVAAMNRSRELRQ